MARNRRISEKYRAHMAALARVYVEAGEIDSHAAAAAVEELKLPSVRGAHFARWKQDPEFAAQVEIERERQANEARTQPSVRGPEHLAWLIRVQEQLKKLHDDTEEDATADRLVILKAIQANGAEIRNEEKHYEELKSKASRRDFAAFVRNMVAWLSANHASKMQVLAPVFDSALKNLDQIVSWKAD